MGEVEFEIVFVTEITKSQSKMRVYLARILAFSGATDDVLQESNKVLWTKRDDWDPKTPFLKWAYRICYFQAKAYLRDKGRERLIFGDDLLELLVSEVPDSKPFSQLETPLNHCLAIMDATKRDLLMRYYGGEESLQDIADENGVSVNTLSQQMRRLRQRLQHCIEQRST